MRGILLYLLVFLIPLSLLAFPEEVDGEGKGRIEGKIVDAASDEPMEYVNIALFNQSDTSLFTGVITSQNGLFKLDNIPYGEYCLTVEFIGFGKKHFPGLVLSEKKKRIQLGTIRISMNAIELEGAQIVADKMAIEYKLDRKVINVSQDLDVAGSSAVEILEKTPSVKVDMDGNVSLRGSSNFRVFINGKPSVLGGSEALQQIPAVTIENIEIITNPSVRYDPDGTAGIINVNLKKEKAEGLTGLLHASAGMGDKFSSGAFINYRALHYNAYAGIDWSDMNYTGKAKERRESQKNDTSFIKATDTQGARIRNGLTFRGGIEYFLSDNTAASFGGEIGRSEFGMDRKNKVHDFSLPAGAQLYYLDDNSFRWSRDFYSLNGDFTRKFDGENHSLRISGLYTMRDGTERQDKKELETDENWNPLTGIPFLLRSSELGPGRESRVEADYAAPAGENGRIETGLQLRIDRDEEEYKVENYDFDLNTWNEIISYSKSSRFIRDIYAGYVVYSGVFRKIEYQAGVRGEYTYRNIEITSTGEDFTIDRPDYFPSVHLSRRLDEKNQFMASYSRRIERPRSWFLEPNETYLDQSTRRIGNPALQPEYTGSWEIGYLRTLQSGTISTDIYYRNTQNAITRFQYLNSETGILYYSFDNLNLEQAIGMEASIMGDISKWLNLNLSASFYHYSLEDRTTAENGTATSYNWDTRGVAVFKYRQNTRLQLNVMYESPSITSQGRVESTMIADITLRQELLQKKLSLTLKMSDIFATRKREFTSRGEGFYTYQHRKPESRIVTFTLNYRINNFKQKPPVIREGNGDMDM